MILITGASGFIGRSLVGQLNRQDRPFKVYTGRVNDPLTIRAELLDVDTIIHLAGAEARDRVRLLQHVDVEGTERLLEESRRAHVRRIILVSRLNTDPNSMYALLRAKGRQERLIERSGIPYTILRSATLFGRDDRFLNVIGALAAWTWPLIWIPGGGQAAMQPLWVEDMVRCLLDCLDRPGVLNKTLEIAGAERLHYIDIARQVMAEIGMRRRPFTPPLKLIRPLSELLFGWLPRAPVTRFYLDRLTAPEVAPSDSVLRQFGFHPARMHLHMAYLRNKRLRWKIFAL